MSPEPTASVADPALAIRVQPLPYQDRLQARDRATIDLAVIHCTELPTLAMARQFGERILYPSGTGNSGHYYIDRDGGIAQYVAIDRIAHHVRGHNARAVGIELVNAGRWPHWHDSRHQNMRQPYPAMQIDALVALLHHLQDILPALHWIAGHEDLDRDTLPATDDPNRRIARKRDPGPLFPWPQVLRDSRLQRLPGPR